MDVESLDIRTLKGGKNGHQLSVTSLAISMGSEDSITLGTRRPIFIYSTSKDASIVKWDFYTGKRLFTAVGGLKPTKKVLNVVGPKKLKAHKGHHDHILAAAASFDGKFLVSIL